MSASLLLFPRGETFVPPPPRPAARPTEGFRATEAAAPDVPIPDVPIPVVPVRRNRSGRQLVIDKCPYCGRKHFHGTAGKQGRGWHGHRRSHCADKHNRRGQIVRRGYDNVGYYLVELSEPLTYPCAGPRK